MKNFIVVLMIWAYQSYATCLLEHNNDLFNCLKHQIETHKIPDKSEFTPLSHEELNNLKDDHHITDQQYDDLVSIAYNSGHPLIYKKALQKTDDYSINLLWIHKQPIALGHFMGQDDKLLKDKVITPIFNWVRKQPDAIINFWYDSAMVSHEAIVKTISIIKDQNNQDYDHINFRDIRDIDLVKQHERIYRQDVAVFLRVDLAKALIADYLVKNSKEKFVVVTDNDVVSISQEHLFDHITLSALELKGHIFGKSGGVSFENSFFILTNQGKELFDGKKYLDWHYEKIISESIKTIESKLDQGLYISPQLIFSVYEHYNKKIYNDLIMYVITDEKYKSDLANNVRLIHNNKPLVFPESQFSGGFKTYSLNLYNKLVDMLKTNQLI